MPTCHFAARWPLLFFWQQQNFALGDPSLPAPSLCLIYQLHDLFREEQMTQSV